MKKIILLVCVVSSQVFAGQKDLNIFESLKQLKVGVEHSRQDAYMQIESIQCYHTINSKELIPYFCTFKDVSFDLKLGTEGNVFQIESSSAKRFYELLASLGARSEEIFGNTILNVSTLECKQGLIHESEVNSAHSEADRTVCKISTY